MTWTQSCHWAGGGGKVVQCILLNLHYRGRHRSVVWRLAEPIGLQGSRNAIDGGSLWLVWAENSRSALNYRNAEAEFIGQRLLRLVSMTTESQRSLSGAVLFGPSATPRTSSIRKGLAANLVQPERRALTLHGENQGGQS
jgi:hypothetical protein